jgi:hypothetical protein
MHIDPFCLSVRWSCFCWRLAHVDTLTDLTCKLWYHAVSNLYVFEGEGASMHDLSCSAFQDDQYSGLFFFDVISIVDLLRLTTGAYRRFQRNTAFELWVSICLIWPFFMDGPDIPPLPLCSLSLLFSESATSSQCHKVVKIQARFAKISLISHCLLVKFWR